jgi:transcriptional regulator with XRE-family HTH domain
MSVYLLALLIGIIAGLRTMTAPAAVAWATYLGRLNLSGTWLVFLGNVWTCLILTALALGLSQSELVKRLGVEEIISYKKVSDYERGQREPTLLILLRYARAVPQRLREAVSKLEKAMLLTFSKPQKVAGDVEKVGGHHRGIKKARECSRAYPVSD